MPVSRIHLTHRALGIGSPEHLTLDEDFGRATAFRWLGTHARDLGFHRSYPHGRSPAPR